jgi:hypothetical protein
MRTMPRTALIGGIAALALIAAGCGDDDSDAPSAAEPAPAASDFPRANGKSLEDVLAETNEVTDEFVASPAGAVFTKGKNRIGFGLFDVGGEQITDADIALYAAQGPTGEARGPFPARIEDLKTDPEFVARTTADDPDAAKVVYATNIKLDAPGEWRLIAVQREGGTLRSTRMPSIEVAQNEDIPDVGDPAVRTSTPTVEDVGNVAAIDTRDPHDTMHDIDLEDALGKRPVVLLFATPALCSSRVCGPVVDVTEQVKSEVGGDVAFIHMEIFEDNDPNKGPRKQVRAFGLQTEPWLFVIDAKGKVSTRIEGAFSLDELRAAVGKVT